MKGHEYPRQLLAQMLEVEVPKRLAVIRAATSTDPDELPWPPDPKAYLLADTLPMKEEQFPCVLITSSTSSVDTNVQAGLGEFIYEYALTIAVAVVSNRHEGYEQSSIGRDRILLAVREALLMNAQLADDCFAVVRALTEVTGAAMENLQSKPTSVGNITFAVRVVEELTDPTHYDITTFEPDVYAVDADGTLPREVGAP